MENLSALKVVELKERLEAANLPTDGLKAVLIERLEQHLQSTGEKVETNDSSPKEQVSNSDAAPAEESSSPKHMQESSPKAAVSPKNSESPKNSAELDDTASLAKKRAERFGIPVYAEKPAEEKTAVESSVPADSKVDMEVEKVNPMEEFRDLIASALPVDCVVLTIDDLMGDGRNAKPMRQYIEANSEEKLKELIKEMVDKIAVEFENDRSKIQVPVKLAAFRLSKTLRFGKFEKKVRDSGRDKKDSGKKKWTDQEWADWKKNSKGGDKRKNYDDGYQKDYKKSRHSDPFESDVEEFISSNRLDKRSAEVMRTESKGMAEYVMDCGFRLHRYDNPSKEVMLRMKEYIQKKKSNQQRYEKPARYSRSRSPLPPARASYRSRSRSDSRDRYARRSRSVSV